MHIYSINCDCSSYRMARKKVGKWVHGPKCRECGAKLGPLQWDYLGFAAGSTEESALRSYDAAVNVTRAAANLGATENSDYQDPIPGLQKQVKDLTELCDEQEGDIQDLKREIRDLGSNVSDLRSDLDEFEYTLQDARIGLRNHEDHYEHGEDNEVTSEELKKLQEAVQSHDGRLWDLENEE